MERLYLIHGPKDSQILLTWQFFPNYSIDSTKFPSKFRTVLFVVDIYRLKKTDMEAQKI